MVALKTSLKGKEMSPSEDLPKGRWEKRWKVCRTFEVKNRQARESISVASASAWVAGDEFCSWVWSTWRVGKFWENREANYIEINKENDKHGGIQTELNNMNLCCVLEDKGKMGKGRSWELYLMKFEWCFLPWLEMLTSENNEPTSFFQLWRCIRGQLTWVRLETL